MLLQAFPVPYVLGVNVVLWGVTVASTAACNSFGSLLAVRIILGALEAVISPSLVLITSTWYQRKEATPRYGIWYCGLGGGQIVGGLLSFAFQHVTTSGFEGWRMMFVVVGGINVVIGVAVVLWLPASPHVAPFLTKEERSLALVRLTSNQTGIGNRPTNVGQIWDAFTDMQVWLLCLITVLSSLPSGVITTFSATLIRNFGYNSKESALLNIPGGVVSILSTMVGTVAIGKGYARWASIVLLGIPTIIGGALMSFLPKHNQGGLLAGIYMINCIVANVAIVYSWTGSNIAGYTKKASLAGSPKRSKN
jgi:MFS family permease